MKQYDIRLAKVPQPPKDCTGEPVMLTDATIQERLDKVLPVSYTHLTLPTTSLV